MISVIYLRQKWDYVVLTNAQTFEGLLWVVIIWNLLKSWRLWFNVSCTKSVVMSVTVDVPVICRNDHSVLRLCWCLDPNSFSLHWYSKHSWGGNSFGSLLCPVLTVKEQRNFLTTYFRALVISVIVSLYAVLMQQISSCFRGISHDQGLLFLVWSFPGHCLDFLCLLMSDSQDYLRWEEFVKQGLLQIVGSENLQRQNKDFLAKKEPQKKYRKQRLQESEEQFCQ